VMGVITDAPGAGLHRRDPPNRMAGKPQRAQRKPNSRALRQTAGNRWVCRAYGAGDSFFPRFPSPYGLG
jgi:hypothetical protein